MSADTVGTVETATRVEGLPFTVDRLRLRDSRRRRRLLREWLSIGGMVALASALLAISLFAFVGR